MDLLKSLLKSRWGVAALLGAAAAAVGGGVVEAGGTEAQAAGTASIAVVLIAGAALVRKFTAPKGEPPAGGAA